MTRKDLYKRLKAHAKRNGKEGVFDAAYPTFQDWESHNFSSHENVEKTLNKLKDKKILSSDWTIEQFYKKFTCDLGWAKNTTYCGGTTTPPTSTDDYVGSYKTETTPEENFEITKKSGEYFVSARGVDVKIVKTSGDNFKIESTVPPASGTVSFKRDSNNKVTGGSADVKVGIGILSKELKGTFIRVGVTPSTGDESSSAQTQDSRYDFGPWKCINDWNRHWGYYSLLGGMEGIKKKYAYEYTTDKVDGRRVKLLYFEDGTVVMRFQDDDSDVPGGKGKWSCDTEGMGYTINWENGEVAVFAKTKGEATKTQGPASSSSGSSNQDGSSASGSQSGTPSESKLPKFREACKSILPCPRREDVEKNKAYYKICMRCPEIQEFQNNPVLKVIYFRKLKENGLTEKTDGIFGPITKAAVEEYQVMNGLVKDGLIGPKTLAQLDKDKSS